MNTKKKLDWDYAKLMVISFISDLHSDINKNSIEYTKKIVNEVNKKKPDVFILAGDLSNTLDNFKKNIDILSEIDTVKLFVPGNHDIWVIDKKELKQGISSDIKYYQLLPKLCEEANFVPVWINPYIIDKVGFCGTIGWYDYSFKSPHFNFITEILRKKQFGRYVWNDKRYVLWKDDKVITELLNEELKKQIEKINNNVDKIVFISHFLPFKELIFFSNIMIWDFFASFMGNLTLGEIIKNCNKAVLTISGHLHKVRTAYIDNLNVYISPIGYKKEWDFDDIDKMVEHRLKFVEI